ncbi:MAG TPA: FAD-dependent oxidoreductase [Pyrinomonadaceae bacterium]|nr:FAD-dependent oxidoreductase [Pyrinomonadaceae bacterium]
MRSSRRRSTFRCRATRIDFFSRFDEVVGHPADYRAHGYLFCATTENHLAYLKANRERQIALGVTNVEWVSPEDIVKMVPQLRVDDILGGTFCPTDGFVDPHRVMMGFMLNARERGVRLWLGTQVTGIETEPRLEAALVPPNADLRGGFCSSRRRRSGDSRFHLNPCRRQRCRRLGCAGCEDGRH